MLRPSTVPSSHSANTDFTHTLIPPFIIMVKQVRTASWRRRSSSIFLFPLKSRLICEIPCRRNHHFIFVTTNGRCVFFHSAWILWSVRSEDDAVEKITWIGFRMSVFRLFYLPVGIRNPQSTEDAALLANRSCCQRYNAINKEWLDMMDD